MRIEPIILNSLLTNKEYVRRILPFIDEAYFLDAAEKMVFDEIRTQINKYNEQPTVESLNVGLTQREGLSQGTFDAATKVITDISTIQSTQNLDWLLDQTETFCKDKALYNAILESIAIIDDSGKSTKPKSAIPELLKHALSVSLDPKVGHDYLEDAESRYDLYHKTVSKIPFDIEMLNLITKGGLAKKTLNCIMASTGVGKSFFMCHVAAATMKLGKNVLYISCEMSEESIGERIDANLMGVNLDAISQMSRQAFNDKITKIKANTVGKLYIKEYPTSSASVLHFKNLVNELRLKKNFNPDIIIVDYLNICASSRIKNNGNTGSYGYIKAIAEELRGLAVELDVPVLTATQSNRAGAGNTDVDLTNTSESWGLPATVDLMLALISTEDLELQNQMLVKQLKNRGGDTSKYPKFLIGIDRARMRIFDVSASAQASLVNTGSDVRDTYGPGGTLEEADQDAFHGEKAEKSKEFKDYKSGKFSTNGSGKGKGWKF